MDTLFEDLHGGTMNKFRFEPDSHLVSSNQNLVHDYDEVNHHEFIDPVFLTTNPDLHSEPSPSSGSSSEGDSPESGEFSNNAIILKFINEILMEEDLEAKPCMLQDCLALQAAEKSFYDVIGEKYPSSLNQILPCLMNKYLKSPHDNFVRSFSNDSSIGSSTSPGNWVDSSQSSDVQTSLVESPEDALLAPYSYGEARSLWGLGQVQGKAGFFLPNGSGEIFDLEGNLSLPLDSTEQGSTVFGIPERYSSNSSDGSKGKKSHQRESGYDNPEQEGRSNKHSAVFPDFSEPSDIFDEVLLPKPTKKSEFCSLDENNEDKPGQQWRKEPKGSSSNGKRTRQKKRNSSREVVDLTTLLTQCAQAVANYDQRTSTQLLKQIREHSSRHGDENQRLAHYFANGLEVRLSAGTPSYNPLGSNGASAADILKAYQVYLTACPFKRMSNFYANRTILKLSEKATRLHIIDFGVLYGFQWPCLIQRLSERPGGPPRLRFTGIEFPQPGFRPSERVDQTGLRLANYCERFNVPFEYNMIAQKWETVRVEDLKLDRDEFTVVNCLDRMKNLPDETVMEDCPRDAVLRLIRRIEPDVFIHGVMNGTHNAPFFLTRFREALFHFSALFDMFEASLPREDQHRLMFEKEVFGRDVMNVVAGEGVQRVERPETYKQWQVRNTRAGFKQVALDVELVKGVRKMVKCHYHRDFVVDEDGRWMFQGWKGRIFQAISCWQPA
ncbi:GRAS transcription factor [Parasponia andersonii]|uniref:GRAS transcription factor n=1 Tax=Parasponia andersonii TaxID=3476 RepID=A0A2P5DQL1_PARAD|nr:GRAS transcription factor [Parasponia andersonii]